MRSRVAATVTATLVVVMLVLSVLLTRKSEESRRQIAKDRWLLEQERLKTQIGKDRWLREQERLKKIEEAQTTAINKAIVANHPHFTSGKALGSSFVGGVLDFMIGKPTSSFPRILELAGEPIDHDIYGERYPTWMEISKSDEPGRVTFYEMATNIWRLVPALPGYEDFTCVDRLLLAVKNDRVVGYTLSAEYDY